MDSETFKLLTEIKSSIETGKLWIPIISSLGGAMVGGVMLIIGTIIQEYWREKREIRKISREKLEFIGDVANEFENALQKDFSMILGAASPNDLNVPPVHENLMNLLLQVSLYHSELSSAANKIEESCMSYISEKRKIFNEVKINIGTGKVIIIDEHHAITKVFNQCLDSKNAFREEMIKISKFNTEKK